MQQAEWKSWHNGLLREMALTVPMEGTWEEALSQVEARLDEAKNSLQGRSPQVTLELGLRSVTQSELSAFVEWLKARYGLLTVAVVATDLVTQEASRQMALQTYLMLPGSGFEEGTEDVFTGNNALYLPHTVRSGQRIVHRGHIVIGGDVNPGSEVVAEGDILVFGTLRGVAHAGSQGDEMARILAGNMRPPQLRIATKIARAPEDSPAPGVRIPEIARIVDGEIQVFPA